MSQKQFRVNLNERERQMLQKIVRSGKEKARKITRCRILLLADGENGKKDPEISDALNVCLATIFNIRRRYCQEGFERAIGEGARSGQPPKFKGKAAAKITAIACSAPPEGQARWSLRLLADRVVELNIVEETVLLLRPSARAISPIDLCSYNIVVILSLSDSVRWLYSLAIDT